MATKDHKAAETKHEKTSLRGPQFHEALEAFIDFDIRLLVTIRDLIIHPIAVARNALDNNTSIYLGQTKLFFFILGLTGVLLYLAQTYDSITVEALFNHQPEPLAEYSSLLGENGKTIEDVNEAMRKWFNMAIAPINFILVISVALLFKTIAPQFTFLGHALLAMISSNAANILGMPLVAIMIQLGLPPTAVSFIPSALQLIYLGIFVWVFMQQTVAGGLARLFILSVVFAILMVIVGIIIQLVLHLFTHAEFGTSPVEFLFRLAMQNAAQAATATGSGTP